jgi:uncharacterized Zn-finger protein
MFGVGTNYGIIKTVMVDWNIFMRESLTTMMPNQERRKEKFYNEMNTKIIHTKTFYCDGSEEDYDKHPRVHYTFDNKVDSTDKTDKGYVVCEYCYAEFIYEPQTTDDYVNKILKGSG